MEYNKKFLIIGNMNAITYKEIFPLDLYKKYDTEKYPKYDNYDAIHCERVEDIPCDYSGVIGVPITFVGKYYPTQFEILGIANNSRYMGDFTCLT